jgi:hypothetical protein
VARYIRLLEDLDINNSPLCCESLANPRGAVEKNNSGPSLPLDYIIKCGPMSHTLDKSMDKVFGLVFQNQLMKGILAPGNILKVFNVETS